MAIAILRKLHEDSDFIIMSEIRIAKDSSVPFKGYRGNVVINLKDNGDIESRGGFVKK